MSLISEIEEVYERRVQNRTKARIAELTQAVTLLTKFDYPMVEAFVVSGNETIEASVRSEVLSEMLVNVFGGNKTNVNIYRDGVAAHLWAHNEPRKTWDSQG